jgi:shikimate dehydrogenase
MLSATTRIGAVLGSPVAHSLSPVLHNAAFAAVGLDAAFVAFDVDEAAAPAALRGAAALGLLGLSVTMPLKDVTARTCDSLTDQAARLGAVNCVVIRDGRLVGHNTDGDGFVAALAQDHGVGLAGRRVVVLGAGGAARSIIAAVASAGAADVAVVNRTPAKAEQAAALGGRVGSLADVPAADVVVNATSVGMGARPGSDRPEDLPCDPALLHAGQVVVDVIVHPVDTAWLVAARRQGALGIDGVGMLVHQAAHAFRHWTGLDPPVDVMTAAARAHLA